MEGILLVLLFAGFVVAPMAGIWKVFSKAGIPGFLAFIPFVNLFFLCKVADRPWYLGFLFFIPLVNIVFSFILYSDIAERYGKGIGYTLGLIFLPMFFFPLLGFTAEPIKNFKKVSDGPSSEHEVEVA